MGTIPKEIEKEDISLENEDIILIFIFLIFLLFSFLAIYLNLL